jgi:hypothetical protein
VGNLEDSILPTVAAFRPSGALLNVSDLIFSHDSRGDKSMTYMYNGQSYYIKFSPSSTNITIF